MNKTKRGLDLSASIISIVLAGLAIVWGLLNFIACMAIFEQVAVGGSMTQTDAMMVTIVFVASIMSIGLAIPFIVLGAKHCKRPAIVNGVVDNRKKGSIALIVILGIFIVESLSILFMVGTYWVGILFVLNVIVAIVAMVLKIIALCLKNKPVEQTAVSAPVNADPFVQFSAPVQPVQPQVQQPVQPAMPIQPADSVEAKILELRHLKDMGVINEEQYDQAVRKLVGTIVEK